MLSKNEHLQKAYNDLRKKTTRVLREIYLTSIAENPQDHRDNLTALKEKLKNSDLLIDGSLDKLIRKELISSEDATTLANDSNITIDICTHLIKAAELLYIEGDNILEGLTIDPIPEETQI